MTWHRVGDHWQAARRGWQYRIGFSSGRYWLTGAAFPIGERCMRTFGGYASLRGAKDAARRADARGCCADCRARRERAA